MPTVELRTQKGHPGPTPYTSRKPNTNVSECGNTPPAECNNNKDRTTEPYKVLTQLKMPLPMSLASVLVQKQQAMLIVL
jgi:hypothetical protein